MCTRERRDAVSSRFDARLSFLREFLRNPHELGSITPSSRHLSQAVVGAIDFAQTRRIVELGPGTGVFTRLLLDRLAPDGELLTIDTNEEFVNLLRHEIPDRRLTPVQDSAERVGEIVAARGWDGVDTIVSGIPYTLLPKQVTASILRASARALRPGGLFVGYQYSPYLRPYLRSVFGHATYRFVLLNVPPAFVYTSRKRTAP